MFYFFIFLLLFLCFLCFILMLYFLFIYHVVLGLLIEISFIPELEKKHKLERILCSMGQWDAHPNRFYKKTLSRVYMYDTLVISWLAHPRDEISNMTIDSGDLV